jgi:hypothetical protein
MQPKLAMGRIAGLLIACAGVGTAAWCARDYARKSVEFQQWLEARPLELAVDLSPPGEFTAPIRQTCSIANAEDLCLELDPGFDQDPKSVESLRLLVATLVIRDAAGQTVARADIDGSTIDLYPGPDAIHLTGFAPFPRGDYVATIQVRVGAPVLAGKRQVLYVKYLLCGCEQWPAAIAGLFATGSGLLGLLSGLVVLPGLLRFGFRRTP